MKICKSHKPFFYSQWKLKITLRSSQVALLYLEILVKSLCTGDNAETSDFTALKITNYSLCVIQKSKLCHTKKKHFRKPNALRPPEQGGNAQFKSLHLLWYEEWAASMSLMLKHPHINNKEHCYSPGAELLRLQVRPFTDWKYGATWNKKYDKEKLLSSHGLNIHMFF